VGDGSPSLKSIVKFEKIDDHRGNEISLVVYDQQPRIFVNARKSEQAY